MHDGMRSFEPPVAAGPAASREHAGRGEELPLVGARFRARPDGRRPAREGERPRFDLTLRGYERRQVDEHLDRQEAELERLCEEVRQLELRLRTAQEYGKSLEFQVRQLRGRMAETNPAAAETGSGAAADRVLRLARFEAAKIRAAAVQECSDLLDRARQEAATHRPPVPRPAGGSPAP
ncbi:MAG TPA: DivIVA domain-containing protein, partial [Pseudonocardia sp.]|nr:DivIVA domain-containing protein [Pseudonocardia sp.]